MWLIHVLSGASAANNRKREACPRPVQPWQTIPAFIIGNQYYDLQQQEASYYWLIAEINMQPASSFELIVRTYSRYWYNGLTCWTSFLGSNGWGSVKFSKVNPLNTCQYLFICTTVDPHELWLDCDSGCHLIWVVFGRKRYRYTDCIWCLDRTSLNLCLAKLASTAWLACLVSCWGKGEGGLLPVGKKRSDASWDRNSRDKFSAIP
jgi:hypothetical protein